MVMMSSKMMMRLKAMMTMLKVRKKIKTRMVKTEIRAQTRRGQTQQVTLLLQLKKKLSLLAKVKKR